MFLPKTEILRAIIGKRVNISYRDGAISISGREGCESIIREVGEKLFLAEHFQGENSTGETYYFVQHVVFIDASLLI